MAAQWVDPPPDQDMDLWPPLEINFASPFELVNSSFRIEKNKVLPITIAVRNNHKARWISLRVAEGDEERTRLQPIPHGFRVLDLNPTDKVEAKPWQCVVFKVRVRINTDGFQYLRFIVSDGENKLLISIHSSVNNPAFAHLDYRPFDESRICRFGPPDGAQTN